MKTENIKFYYNGIKVNGGKLIRCFYGLDDNSVTIAARDYDDLPADVFAVENDTDYYTDYFDTDSARLTPEHPLYKYARAAALKAAMRGEPEYITKLEKEEQEAKTPGRYHWRSEDAIRAEIDSRQARLDRNAAELATLPKGHPTAADLAAVEEMNLAAESARKAQEHAAEIAAREKVLRQRNEGRAYIEQIAAEYPIRPGAPVVSVGFSENPAFYSWMDAGEALRLSVAAAEIILKHFDEETAADENAGYDKTDFTIEYTDENGEPSTYEGRYDLGDNDGGLVAHIRSYGEFLRDKGSFGNGNVTPENRKTAREILDFASMLEGYTASGCVVAVQLAPCLEKLRLQQAEAKAAPAPEPEPDEDEMPDYDIYEAVQILTDDQIEAVILERKPGKDDDIVRFFLQELFRRNEKNALDVFRRWQSQSE